MKLGDLVIVESTRHQVPPEIIAAIIYQESKGQRWAVRYEPGFFNRYIAQKDRGALPGYIPREGDCTLITEKHLRACSFGLMQIMGETAREIGFKGPLLSLVVPEINLHYGCKYFAKKLKFHNGDEDKALLSWNGGAEKKYPDFVKRWVNSDLLMQAMSIELQEA